MSPEAKAVLAFYANKYWPNQIACHRPLVVGNMVRDGEAGIVELVALGLLNLNENQLSACLTLEGKRAIRVLPPTFVAQE